MIETLVMIFFVPIVVIFGTIAAILLGMFLCALLDILLR